MSRFADDTAVRPLGGGRYEAVMDRGWWIQRGPNGGYLAAVVLRAILAEVADPERRPRSLTLHYLRPPVEGPCEVAVTVERTGRGLTTASARCTQGGKDCLLALAALGVDREGVTFADEPVPMAELPAQPLVRPQETVVPLTARYDMRPTMGGVPFEVSDEALSGGWIRTLDDDPVDDVLLAALTDAWLPAVFTKGPLPVGVPTVDLTIHFRARPVHPSPWALVRFRTTTSADGYLEEDGAVWDPDGRLLAQSRQLAIVVSP